ncbi:MAG: hypothetical protein ABIP97_09805 [Chthoniobacterales bacterium]
MKVASKQYSILVESRKCRQELAAALQANLGQHLIGTLLTAHALATALSKRNAPEASEAESLVTLLTTASSDVKDILVKLDKNLPITSETHKSS